MKNKKGAELSVNVIIVAVIALLVLVVLFALFTGRMGIFSKGVSNCETLSGGKASCSSTECNLDNGQIEILNACKSGEHCCKPATTQ